MGRRKSKALRPTKKKLPKLETSFDCPFCCHVKTIDVTIDRKASRSVLFCRICQTTYMDWVSSRLTQPIDVYSRWIDRCYEENEKQNASSRSGGIAVAASGGTPRSSTAASSAEVE